MYYILLCACYFHYYFYNNIIKFNFACNSYLINNVTEFMTLSFFGFSTCCLVLYWVPSVAAIGYIKASPE